MDAATELLPLSLKVDTPIPTPNDPATERHRRRQAIAGADIEQTSAIDALSRIDGGCLAVERKAGGRGDRSRLRLRAAVDVDKNLVVEGCVWAVAVELPARQEPAASAATIVFVCIDVLSVRLVDGLIGVQ